MTTYYNFPCHNDYIFISSAQSSARIPQQTHATKVSRDVSRPTSSGGNGGVVGGGSRSSRLTSAKSMARDKTSYTGVSAGDREAMELLSGRGE